MVTFTKRIPRFIPVLVGSLLLCLQPTLLQSQALQATTNRMAQLVLCSSRVYDNPNKDVAIECRLTGPKGMTLHVAGFWDGDNTYRIRFALPTAGDWSYSITCNDTTNLGLHEIHGVVHVQNYVGSNPFYLKGPLRVSDNHRYLTYADGDAFFYLGDTAWEIAWKSRDAEMLAYLADRTRKGFNALQIVVMSHQFFDAFGVRNRHGADFFLNSNLSQLNPRYFDYLDRIVQAANDSGFVVALVPLWASMMEYYARPGLRALTVDQSMLLARYIGARYAGSNVLWIVGGDNEYLSIEKRNFWAAFARTLLSASGDSHLATVHPKAWTASFDYFDKQDTWLSFNMYQSSHVTDGDYTSRAALTGFFVKNTKPLLNGEAAYEDIYNNLWQPGDTTQVRTFRIDAAYVRQASYESLLSGALVGITYGANGIWQWNTPELPGTHLPRYTATEAMSLPGSSHMRVLKEVMLKIPWYSISPTQNLLADFRPREKLIPVASSGAQTLVYIPRQTQWIKLRRFPQSELAQYFWINPVSGDSSVTRQITGALLFTPPDTSDWILVVRKSATTGFAETMSAPAHLLEQNYPNPFNPRTTIRYHVVEDACVAVKVYTLLGSEVATLVNDEHTAGSHSVEFDASLLPSGVYFYRISSPWFSETKKFVLLK
jgi:hypothetical protein